MPIPSQATLNWPDVPIKVLSPGALDGIYLDSGDNLDARGYRDVRRLLGHIKAHDALLAENERLRAALRDCANRLRKAIVLTGSDEEFAERFGGGAPLVPAALKEPQE